MTKFKALISQSKILIMNDSHTVFKWCEALAVFGIKVCWTAWGWPPVGHSPKSEGRVGDD